MHICHACLKARLPSNYHTSDLISTRQKSTAVTHRNLISSFADQMASSFGLVEDYNSDSSDSASSQEPDLHVTPTPASEESPDESVTSPARTNQQEQQEKAQPTADREPIP